MGRKTGGKNHGAINEVEKEPITVSAKEKDALTRIFTCIDKDFISISDLQQNTGLSYDTCAKIVREVKAISDTFHISGIIHRTDYFMFISKRFTLISEERTIAVQEGV